MKKNKPILVTGSHRSGSTWIGKTIALDPTIGYIHEPFNPDYYPHQLGRYTAKFQHWFNYICAENEVITCAQALEATLSFKYSLIPAIQELFLDNPHRELIEPVRILRDYFICAKHRLFKARPLVKDPIALFSAEWLANKFDMDVVISIRHPAAFVGSLKVAAWDYPFGHFLEQKLLMENFLFPYQAEIQNIVDSKQNVDEIEKAALLWKIMHYRIFKYQESHPDWLFIRHEDLSQNPLAEFKTIFNYLNLNYSESLQKTILQYTSTKSNSQDLKTFSKKATRAMDSQANIKSWKKRLSQEEIIKIRELVEDISAKFYVDTDWE